MRRKFIQIGAWSCLALALFSGCAPDERVFNGASSSSSSTGGGETNDCKLGSARIGNCRVR